MGHRYNITIDHDSTPHSSDRSSSSVTDDGEDSSGTGVQVSPSSLGESQEYSEQEEGWLLYPNEINPLYPDEINPSDSASRPRTSNHHRPVVEAPTPAQAHRQPSRRQAARIHHHSHPRAHRPPPAHHLESVDPNEDWPAYGRGPPLAHGRGYPQWAHVVPQTSSPNYTPSYSSTQAYSPFPSTSVVPANQLVPFANPAGGYAYAPYQSQGGGSNPGYFPPGQQGGPSLGNPVAPHNIPHYAGQEVMPHSSAAAFYSYNNQGYPMSQPMVQPMGQPMAAPQIFQAYPTLYSPPVLPSTPSPAPAPVSAPVENSKDDEKYDEKFARLEKLLMDQKAEQEAKEAAAKKAAEDQAAKAAADKQRADEIAAAAAAAAAAATEEAEKRAAEKAAVEAAKVAEEAAKASEEAAKIAAEVTKAAEETAKAREEAAKAAEETAKAKEEAAQSKAAADEAAAAAAAAAMPPPPPKEKKKPIKFKDAVGRKFSFPFHLCNTWIVS